MKGIYQQLKKVTEKITLMIEVLDIIWMIGTTEHKKKIDKGLLKVEKIQIEIMKIIIHWERKSFLKESAAIKV